LNFIILKFLESYSSVFLFGYKFNIYPL